MYSRSAIRLFGCAALLGSAGIAELAHAQGAPFTIRRPPDGATVREKVNVEIPRNSIGKNGFVAIYLDDKFYVAVPPSEIQEGSAATRGQFTFTWDTKGSGISDGPHTIRAVLYEPAPDQGPTAVTEKQSTSVRLNVANIIHNGPSSLRLRYKLPEGQNLEYSRVSTAKVTNSGITFGESNDTLLAQTDSKLLLDIMNPTPVALVRNKLTELSILQQGQETSMDPSQLSASMYQEINPLGKVQYETGSGTGIDEYMAQGLPVNNTLELPLLPNSPVSIGDSWTTPNQRLDIPGIPPALQKKVPLENKLVDLEWEGKYETAKIHQTFDGSLTSDIQFGAIPVTSPHVKFERDIYFAYNSGRLIKTVRTITITGRTTAQTDQTPSAGGAGYPGMGGPGMGNMGYPGMGGGMGMQGGAGRGMGYPGMGGSSGGPPMGYPGMSGGGIPGGMGKGMQGGAGRGMGYPGMGGSSGGPPMGYPGMGQGSGMGRPGSGAGGALEADHPVTLKAVTDTELIKVIGP
jgi:hypothetical protein